MAKAVLNNYIWLDTSDVPTEIVEDIKDYLTIPNLARIEAIEQHVKGAKRLPELMRLYEPYSEGLILPRGFYTRLQGGLQRTGIALEVEDQMKDEFLGRHYYPIRLRGYQQQAVNDLAYYAQGIYQAPTGSGKTVTMLELINRLNQPTLVIVNKKELVQQWSDRAEQFMKLTPGFIGDGRWEVKPYLTIATQQTLWSRRKELIDDGFFKQWGCVILDECHSVQAETYHEIIELFIAKYRFGISATPKKTGHFKIAENVLGPIVHRTAKQPLRDSGYLITPKVFVIPTQFHTNFQPNEVSEDTGRLTKRNNYHEVLSKLVRNSPRNKLIVQTALQLPGRCILILTKRIEHIERLKAEFQSQGQDVLLLTGQETLEQRMEVYEKASLGNIIILSTLADEAVDIPRIDTLFLAFPGKNIDGFRQQIGRGERIHPDKKDFFIIDFVDYTVEPIKQQYLDRRRELYRADGIPVTKTTSATLSADKS